MTDDLYTRIFGLEDRQQMWIKLQVLRSQVDGEDRDPSCLPMLVLLSPGSLSRKWDGTGSRILRLAGPVCSHLRSSFLQLRAQSISPSE